MKADAHPGIFLPGHAIYSLDAVKDVIKVSTKTLLEEPRAELTALHTLLILQKKGFVDQVSPWSSRKWTPDRHFTMSSTKAFLLCKIIENEPQAKPIISPESRDEITSQN